MKIVCISDTHTYGRQIDVTDGDVLIHAGDHTFTGQESQVKKALKWLESLPHKHKLFIAGNHDFFFDPKAPREYRSWKLKRHYSLQTMLAKFPSLTYLCDSGVEIDGVNFYGSPWTHWYEDWAFNFSQGEKGLYEARNTWYNIPTFTHVLITHTPPQGILDSGHGISSLGCPMLRRRLDELPLLRLHVFGHIHESYGRVEHEMPPPKCLLGLDLDLPPITVTFVNAAINTIEYKPTNKPIIVEI